ncbi:hypothetical protein DOY81_002356 [Sarcophaga bullata]|nr:hypothetical protein DOY81_002356 [Sarcophaga bullata]
MLLTMLPYAVCPNQYNDTGDHNNNQNRNNTAASHDRSSQLNKRSQFFFPVTNGTCWNKVASQNFEQKSKNEISAYRETYQKNNSIHDIK